MVSGARYCISWRHFVLQAYVEGKMVFWCRWRTRYKTIPAGQYHLADESRFSGNCLYKDRAWAVEIFGDPVHYRIGRLDEIRGPQAQLFQDIAKCFQDSLSVPYCFVCIFKVETKEKQPLSPQIYSKAAWCATTILPSWCAGGATQCH